LGVNHYILLTRGWTDIESRDFAVFDRGFDDGGAGGVEFEPRSSVGQRISNPLEAEVPV